MPFFLRLILSTLVSRFIQEAGDELTRDLDGDGIPDVVERFDLWFKGTAQKTRWRFDDRLYAEWRAWLDEADEHVDRATELLAAEAGKAIRRGRVRGSIA